MTSVFARLRRFEWSSKKALAGLALAIVLYNQIFAYWWNQTDWAELTHEPGTDILSILFVADPQIVGLNDEPSGIIGAITRWDCDNYLSTTFHLAYNYANPDVVIFMGDLVDEGSNAEPEAMAIYKKRFYKIFVQCDSSTSNKPVCIYIPGDNDIGGEGVDMLTEEKKKKFSDNFPYKTYIGLDWVEFVHVGLLPNYNNDYSSVPKRSKDKMRIILSHVPMMPYHVEITESLQPDFLVSAHTHKARHSSANYNRVETDDNYYANRYNTYSQEKQVRLSFSLRQKTLLHEITIPTCSYRMGVYQMGYGYAIIEKESGFIHYTILWSPGRFPQLVTYLVATVFIAAVYIRWILCRGWRGRGQAKRKR